MNNYPNITIWERFRRLRKALQVTQGEAEAESGIPQKDISQLETGKKKFIPKEYIIYLYDKGADLNWLFGGKGDLFRKEALEQQEGNSPGNTYMMASEPEVEYSSQKKVDRVEAENQKLKVENATLMKVIKTFSVTNEEAKS